MIEKDRFKPSIWLYKVMMRELAYIGDIDTVFSLFKRVKINLIKKYFRQNEVLNLGLILNKDDWKSRPRMEVAQIQGDY